MEDSSKQQQETNNNANNRNNNNNNNKNHGPNNHGNKSKNKQRRNNYRKSKSPVGRNRRKNNNNNSPQHTSPPRVSLNDVGAGTDSFFDDVALSTNTTPNNAPRCRNHRRKSRSPKRSRSPKKPALLTVIVNRVRLYDSPTKKDQFEEASQSSDDDNPHHNTRLPQPNIPVSEYSFDPNPLPNRPPSMVAVTRAPYHAVAQTVMEQFMPDKDIIDTSIPNPLPPGFEKYWAQRRRLFSRFDMGIQMDHQGWYSVTPEVIADHVAHRVADLGNKLIILDAFCGMGGNAIAFAKIPPEKIALVVCVDIDRSKLRMAAYNACLYDIPSEKLVFIEASSLFILQHCFRDGLLCLDKSIACGVSLPPRVSAEVHAGFHIGGLNLLPNRIDAVFMDPPWGGSDYNSLGKNGYFLEKHMRIECATIAESPTPKPSDSDVVSDDFFDCFGSGQPSTKSTNKNYVNGVQLLKMAANATRNRLVIYDLPKNTNKTALGQSVLAAGYCGNIKLEEHLLNARLKTVTAYMGVDFSHILH